MEALNFGPEYKYLIYIYLNVIIQKKYVLLMTPTKTQNTSQINVSVKLYRHDSYRHMYPPWIAQFSSPRMMSMK